MTQTATKRPSWNDLAVRELAADELLPQFAEWSGAELDEEQAAEVRKLLVDGMRWHGNGYDFAKEFESAGWEPDHDLVDLLENINTFGAHRKLVREWIAATGATPRLAVGTAVVLPEGKDAGVAGEIVRVNEGDGTYTVYCESLGHVREGLGTGTTGRIFAWETLESAQ